MTQRQITATINPEAKARVEMALDISPVAVEFLSAPDQRGETEYRGFYFPALNKIQVITAFTWIQSSPLPVVRQCLVKTLLHEYRHAYQQAHWDPAEMRRDAKRPYAIRRCETDANEFAAVNTRHFLDLIRLTTETPKPYKFEGQRARGFARLSEVSK